MAKVVASLVREPRKVKHLSRVSSTDVRNQGLLSFLSVLISWGGGNLDFPVQCWEGEDTNRFIV